MKGCARPAPPRKAQPRRAALTLQLAVASWSAFRPSIGMLPPSKASVIEMCWSSRRLVPFDLRVGHLYGRLPSCIVSWFRFDAPATEMLGAGSVHLARMVFLMENGLWRPENAIFPPLRGRVTASAVYHPACMPEKSSYTCRQIHWNLVPDRKKMCSRLRNRVFVYGRTSFKRLLDCELALLGVSNAPKMTF